MNISVINVNSKNELDELIKEGWEIVEIIINNKYYSVYELKKNNKNILVNWKK